MTSPKLQPVPPIRVRAVRSQASTDQGSLVLYWMTAFRRLDSNFALQRAVELAQQFRKPLVILEGLRCNYRWASDRFHQFVLDGMVDNAEQAQTSQATYYAYVEPEVGHASGLVEAIAEHACAIVTDDFPCFFHPAIERLVQRWPCSVEFIDSNTIVPMRQFDRTFTVAHSYRRAMQKIVYEAMPEFPTDHPLTSLSIQATSLPQKIVKRWQLWTAKEVSQKVSKLKLGSLPIDHDVAPCSARGGSEAARKTLTRFIKNRLDDYSEARNEPDEEGSSWLSPYLHFGHISPQQVFQAIARTTRWSWEKIAKPNGSIEGFWNMGENAEAFMDQLMTWREIGFNMCHREPKFDRYESLPDWALRTLEKHAADPRGNVYSLEEFENAQTHDPLWNSAQRQLIEEGRIHNYLRMLWGKKILHWTETPREALRILIELNNKYALDGRDPNSYSGIFWVLGRYDRAWGPERPIFGKVRYMTSESTQSKHSVKKYLERYADKSS